MAFAWKQTVVSKWFESAFPEPTAIQRAAWPLIEAGSDVLLVSPTGTGKTFAAFLSVLNELALRHEAGTLGGHIHAVYISPLRALTYDLEKNLNRPLREIYGTDPPVRVGLRTGDTTSSERQRQFSHPPHILLTTPESLSILLSQKNWIPVLDRVRWVVVDEIHALAENKRGSHLSLTIERLAQVVRERAAEAKLHRVGLSATVAPLTEVAQFLVGTGREVEVVDAASSKQFRLEVYSPLGKDPYPPSGYTGQRLIRELGKLVARNRTTLVFTNTRSGAEASTFWLKEELPGLADQIECHHASLDRDLRREVEDRLKAGELRAVVCSTSLELGIDIGSIDQVVMLSTPKGVGKALQRTGRSGHNIHSVSRGLLMATNLSDLVECSVTALMARGRRLDPIRIPTAPLDVLAQHLTGLGCLRRWTRDEAFDLVRRAYPFRDLARSDFDDVLEFLAGGGESLRKQYTEVFGKITLDDEGFETREGVVRRDFLQNIGVIPSEGSVRVQLKNRNLGSVEEGFMRQLQPGDVFMIGGRSVRLERVGLMECFVSRAEGVVPTVPRWNANKMPLAGRIADEIAAFRGELRQRLIESGEGFSSLDSWIADRLDCGARNAEIIRRMHVAQFRLSDIPTRDFLFVEEYLETATPEQMGVRPGRRRPVARRNSGVADGSPARHYFFHSLIGRTANEALSRVVAARLSRLRGGNAISTPDDYGFVLTVTPVQRFNVDELRELLRPEEFEHELQSSLDRSHLLNHYFRNAAQTGLMVYRNYFGEQKSLRKVQWSSEVLFNVLRQYEPRHVLLREARRDVTHGYLDVDGALAFVREQAGRTPVIRPVAQVPPLAFAMYATKIKEALMVEDPRETLERLYHQWWEKLEHEPGPT